MIPWYNGLKVVEKEMREMKQGEEHWNQNFKKLGYVPHLAMNQLCILCQYTSTPQ